MHKYKSYKKYLQEWIGLQLRSGRGIRAKLALSINCQTSYISRVLSGTADFSLEQAGDVNLFLGHSELDAHHFLLLVQHARAGSELIRSYFKRQLDLSIQSNKDLKNHLPVKSKMDRLAVNEYYSSWHYAAIHVLTSIAGFQTPLNISKRLSLPLKRVSEILEFLLSFKLVIKEKQYWVMGSQSIHLERSSPNMYRHHLNWRVRTTTVLEQNPVSNFHYSSVMSISKEAREKISSMLLQSVKKGNQLMEGDSEDLLYFFGIDFYEVK